MDQHYTAELTDAEALALAQAATMETEREPSADERAGMDWSSLPESERAAWVGEGAQPQAFPTPSRAASTTMGETRRGSLTLRTRSI
jgi:hypothetical protein